MSDLSTDKQGSPSEVKRQEEIDSPSINYKPLPPLADVNITNPDIQCAFDSLEATVQQEKLLASATSSDLLSEEKNLQSYVLNLIQLNSVRSTMLLSELEAHAPHSFDDVMEQIAFHSPNETFISYVMEYGEDYISRALIDRIATLDNERNFTTEIAELTRSGSHDLSRFVFSLQDDYSKVESFNSLDDDLQCSPEICSQFLDAITAQIPYQDADFLVDLATDIDIALIMLPPEQALVSQKILSKAVTDSFQGEEREAISARLQCLNDLQRTEEHIHNHAPLGDMLSTPSYLPSTLRTEERCKILSRQKPYYAEIEDVFTDKNITVFSTPVTDEDLAQLRVAPARKDELKEKTLAALQEIKELSPEIYSLMQERGAGLTWETDKANFCLGSYSVGSGTIRLDPATILDGTQPLSATIVHEFVHSVNHLNFNKGMRVFNKAVGDSLNHSGLLELLDEFKPDSTSWVISVDELTAYLHDSVHGSRRGDTTAQNNLNRYLAVALEAFEKIDECVEQAHCTNMQYYKEVLVPFRTYIEVINRMQKV